MEWEKGARWREWVTGVRVGNMLLGCWALLEDMDH